MDEPLKLGTLKLTWYLIIILKHHIHHQTVCKHIIYSIYFAQKNGGVFVHLAFCLYWSILKCLYLNEYLSNRIYREWFGMLTMYSTIYVSLYAHEIMILTKLLLNKHILTPCFATCCRQGELVAWVRPQNNLDRTCGRMWEVSCLCPAA